MTAHDQAPPASPDLPVVGFVGLGTMGRPIAGHILAAGYPLVVHDLHQAAAADLLERGATWGASARDVAERSRIVLTALPGPREVEQVYGAEVGLLAGARPGTYLIDVSTSTPAGIRAMAAEAEERGVVLLDAPLSGGVRGARKGTLTIMVGGDPEAYAVCEPLLRTFGEHVFLMGPLGAGYITKLVNNYMGISNAIAAIEAMVIGVKAGVEPARLLEVVNLGTGASHMTRTLFPFLIFPGRFEPVRFAMNLAVKDVALALELAEAVGVPTTVGPAVHGALVHAADRGLAEADMSAYVTLLEEAADVKVRT